MLLGTGMLMLFHTKSGVTNMLGKRNLVFLISSLILSVNFLGNAMGANKPMTESEIKSKAIKDLNAAAYWSIENGIMEYYGHGRDINWIQKKTRDEWAVTTYSGPVVDSDRFMARFMIKAAGVHYELLVLERMEYDSYIYEYWVQKVSGSELSGEIDWRCRFMVTRADDTESKREILKEETQFFDSYKINDSIMLKFPVNDAKSLHDLAAWLYPDCYKNSILKNYKVIETKSGEYVKKKISWFERMFLQ